VPLDALMYLTAMQFQQPSKYSMNVALNASSVGKF